jgi:hypothetical protein
MLYPFILGVLSKVYDDIVDIHLNISEDVVQILKTTIVLFFVLTTMDNFFFAFPCFFVCAMNAGFDNSFWKSLLPVSAIMTIITFPMGQRVMLVKLLATLVGVAGVLGLATIEEKLFPEEVSPQKITFRSALVSVFVLGIAIMNADVLPFPSFSIKPILTTAYVMLGFVMVSVINMTYLLFFSGKTLEELNTTGKP